MGWVYGFHDYSMHAVEKNGLKITTTFLHVYILVDIFCRATPFFVRTFLWCGLLLVSQIKDLNRLTMPRRMRSSHGWG